MTPDDFLARVEQAVETRATTATGIGKGALGDPTFVFELRKGRKVSLEIAQRVLSYIETLPLKDAA